MDTISSLLQSVDRRIPVVVSVAGVALMLAGLAGYIYDPASLYEAVFAVGFVLMVLGYIAAYLMSRMAMADLDEGLYIDGDGRPMYILDEDYDPDADRNDAVIEDLESAEE